MSQPATPPEPPATPVLGHGRAFASDALGFLESSAELGPVVGIRVPGRRMYLLTEPDLIEDVLHDPARFGLGRAQQREFQRFEEHAVVANTGDRWRRLRGAVGPAFARENLDRYRDPMLRVIRRRIEGWDPDEPFDLHREAQYLTLHVVAATLLDVDVRGEEAPFLTAVDLLVERSDATQFSNLLPDWIPTPRRRRMDRAVEEVHEFVGQVVAQRAEAHNSTGNVATSGSDGATGDGDGATDSDPAGTAQTEEGDGRPPDALSILLDAHERGELTLEELRHNVVMLFLAGTDTTATALTYALYLLDRHPEERQRVRAEIDAIAGGDPTAIDDWRDLERTRNAVREALRLYPPAFAVVRRAREDVELGGYEIAAGSDLMVSQWVMHRDERFFPDPETFDPDRWDRDVDRPEYAYFPFSGGPRHCMGMYFAQQELALAVATIVGTVDYAVEPQGELTLQPALSLRPEVELRTTVRPR